MVSLIAARSCWALTIMPTIPAWFIPLRISATTTLKKETGQWLLIKVQLCIIECLLTDAPDVKMHIFLKWVGVRPK